MLEKMEKRFSFYSKTLPRHEKKQTNMVKSFIGGHHRVLKHRETASDLVMATIDEYLSSNMFKMYEKRTEEITNHFLG
ncbi:unnamed protein product [Rhizopus microsporus]